MNMSYFLKDDPETRVDLITSKDGRVLRRTYTHAPSGGVMNVTFDIRAITEASHFTCEDINGFAGIKDDEDKAAALEATRQMLKKYLLYHPNEVCNN